MLQRPTEGGRLTSQFRAGAGARLGRFRLLELVAGARPAERRPLSQVEWPEAFEQGFAEKYGEGTLLGKGGQGEVWKAEDPSRGRPVAVKIFLDTASGDGYLTWKGASEEQRKALLAAKSECDMMMLLSEHKADDPAGHSHILNCLESHIVSEVDSGLPAYVVLEFGGDDLTKWIQKRNGTRGEPEEARKWIAQILQAVRFLQAQDPPILHRDLKPDNVMLAAGADGEHVVKLFDFGCALNGTEESRHSGFHLKCFTLSYAPGEVSNKNCMPEPESPATFELPYWSFDMYSLGMMYWQMLCPNISMKNDPMLISKFMCLPPPLGTLGYKAGTLRELFDSKSSAGDPMCPRISDDEVLLIESMLGPYDKRPSPGEVLKFPLFDRYTF